MGVGGSNPGLPGDTKIASVVLDPHEPGITTTAKFASIRIYHGGLTVRAIFQIHEVGLTLRQAGNRRSRRAPHSRQNLASGGLS